MACALPLHMHSSCTKPWKLDLGMCMLHILLLVVYDSVDLFFEEALLFAEEANNFDRLSCAPSPAPRGHFFPLPFATATHLKQILRIQHNSWKRFVFGSFRNSLLVIPKMTQDTCNFLVLQGLAAISQELSSLSAKLSTGELQPQDYQVHASICDYLSVQSCNWIYPQIECLTKAVPMY